VRALLLNRRVLLGTVLVAGLLAVALWPETVVVDVAVVTAGPLRVTIDEEGETRIRYRFVVSTPVAGRMRRIDLEPGDPVTRGVTIIARVQPEPPTLLDARSRAEAEAAVASARAALGRARAEESRARTAVGLATTELERARMLAEAGLGTAQMLEQRSSEATAAEQSLLAATFAVATVEAELARAQARVGQPAAVTSGGVVEVRAPIDGVVLRRHRESEGIVASGAPLVDLGDPTHLEIVSDLLSTDAVRVEAGARVLVEQWGGPDALEARVRRVEPAGFTKISALGVEEQRVNVIMDFTDPAGAWARLGDAYRVEVRIVDWESERVLKVPTSALFRRGADWAVFVVEGGLVRTAILQLGHRSGVEAEVTGGLSEGATVVVHPGDTLTDGMRVEPRDGRLSQR
jgi:HlyD family secretion protein